jgi:RNase adapter protein RapZ
MLVFSVWDNLPIGFLAPLARSLNEQGHRRVAVAADVRIGADLGPLLRETIDSLKASGMLVQVVFLNAQTQSLIQRYSETRRRHPLSLRPERISGQEGEAAASSLLECIEEERRILSNIESLGMAIDTTDLKPASLRAWIREFMGLRPAPVTLLFQSFAFKTGIPLDADLVFDVRCLPNPYYVPALKPLTGLDPPVIQYLCGQPEVGQMIQDIGGFVRRWLPAYEADQRSYLTVALGCTGGQHRSVYCAEALAQTFTDSCPTLVRHRTLTQRGLN